MKLKVFLLFLGLLLLSQFSLAQDWFDNDWVKRLQIIVSNSTGSTLTDYQVKVEVDYKPSMRNDFDDIRFTLSDGTTLLNHWKESYSTASSATFWVKVPSLPDGETTIYMYYDNPSANDESNGEAVFEFFVLS